MDPLTGWRSSGKMTRVGFKKIENDLGLSCQFWCDLIVGKGVE